MANERQTNNAPYVEQDFKNGEVLTADMLNKMEYQIASNVYAILEQSNNLGANGMIYENSQLFLTRDGKIIAGPVEIVSGPGSGEGGTSNEAVMSLKNTTGWVNKAISLGGSCLITATWSSLENELPTGDGSLRVMVNGTTKISRNIKQGDFEVEVGEHLTLGENTVNVMVSDVYGNSRRIMLTIMAVSLTISSSFDASVPYTGEIPFTYTPVGSMDKTVYIKLDGRVIHSTVVTTSGRQQSFTIPAQSHGAHTLEVWFEADIDGVITPSNVLYYEMICLEDGNTTPVIVLGGHYTGMAQYDTLPLSYMVYSPTGLYSQIELLEGETVTATLTVDRTWQVWSYRAEVAGEIVLSIRCGGRTKRIPLVVGESTIPVEAETDSLALYLSAAGRSNNEENPAVWKSFDIEASFTGFNWVSDGWKTDDDGVTVLRVAGDGRVTIPYKPFAHDCRTTGKTFEIEFATRNVLNYDTVLFSCFSGGRGIEVTTQKAIFASEQSSIGTQYKEEEHVRLTFVVEKRSDNKLLLCYINGILSGAVLYPDDDDFAQLNPVDITIGSNDCTTDIYCIRVYDNNLTRYQILDNWIADTASSTLKNDRYVRNAIYDDYGQMTIATLKKDVPYMVIECPVLPSFKGDKKTCSGYYVDPVNPERSFTFTDAQIDVQGTSSQYYYVKNWKTKYKSGVVLYDNTESETYQMNDNAVPTDTFTFKADVASSEGANNVVLAQLYNELCPVLTPPQEEDPHVRQTIDGHPMVIFWNDGTNIKFYGKYNFNNDKGTPEVFGFEEGDESWEIKQNGTDRVGWHSADFSGTDWQNDFEARYPEDNTDTDNLEEFAEWLVSTDTDQATNRPMTVVTIGGTTYARDTAEYRLAKFRKELPLHADVADMVFYYLFTEIFLCIDQREKNAFPTLFNEMGKWIMFFYDADSSLGTDNKGNLAFDYFLEDIDFTEAGEPVFNGQNSVLWKNLRETFYDEIMAEYKRLRTSIRGDGRPLISYDVVNDMFEKHQGTWSEAIFNEDGYRKSIEPLVLNKDTTYLAMLQGKKEQHRKWWLYNRFRYLDSKYITGSSMETRILIRCHAKANVTLTAYVNMYGHVYYNSEMVEHRMYRGQPYEFVWAASGAEDTVIGINDADMLTDLGDLSPLMVETIDISAATHLTYLKVGDASSDFRNGTMNTLTLGNNTLLRSLDVRNCTALAQAVDASGCTGLEEAYFDNTSITGLTLPNGGAIKILHLPGTITNLTLRNLTALTEFVLPSYSNITTLRLENNSAVVDPLAILSELAANSRVRIIGFDWEMTYSELCEFVAILDTMRGLDENGNNTDLAQISGTIYIEKLHQLEYNAIVEMQKRYPGLTVNYGSIETYTVSFYNGDVLLYTASGVAYGGTAEYVGDTPTKEAADESEDWKFIGWDPEPVNVTADMVCYAQFKNMVSLARLFVARTLKGAYVNDRVETVGAFAFQGTAVQIVSMPNVTTVANYAFNNCTNLVGLNMPLVERIGTYAFTGCNALPTVTFPSLTYLDGYAFQGDSVLDYADLGNCGTIMTNAFYNCKKLGTLILRKTDAVCTLTGTNTLYNTLIASGTGYIYVPAALVNSYKTATNWSTYAAQFRAIEDYPNICGGE